MKAEAITLDILRFHCLDRHHCAVQYHQLMDRIIDRFQAAHPHVRVSSTVMRNWYQLEHTLGRRLPTGDPPDLFFTSGESALREFASRGLVHDLSRDLDGGWRECFYPVTLEPLKVRGREFGVPLEQGMVCVWYNRRIFERFGLSVPATFDELRGLCTELAGHGIVPLAMGTVEKWFLIPLREDRRG